MCLYIISFYNDFKAMNTSALKKHSAGERSPAVNPVPTSTGGQGWVVRLPEAPQRARTSPNSLGAGGSQSTLTQPSVARVPSFL